ncbi:MAG: chorismate synthase [Bacteroidetes bacterium]|nr:chorismate synthase [Bacteroidota bacterium]
MSSNSFGHTLVLTTFGESHGPAVGGVLDGFPSLVDIDVDFIQSEVNRRRTGQSFFSSARKEDDVVEFLSGIFEGKSTGAPIAFLARNVDAKPEHYTQLKETYRPSHADFTWDRKFGIRDYQGGGRASARETLARVVGGALAKLYLRKPGIGINGYVSQIGNCRLPEDFILSDYDKVLNSEVGCPDPETEQAMLRLLEETKAGGDTLGGIVSCRIIGVPAGLGEPVFDKLSADLGKAMLSIPSVKGFEYGSGFGAAVMKGSEHNDIFIRSGNTITTKTNFSGGIQGGISNGNEIFFRVAFKPVASLMKDQETVDQKGEKVLLKGKGRHDVCVVPRSIVIVEAMAALVIADHYLMQLQRKL